MPIIRFTKNIPEINVYKGANLMLALRTGGRPVASSCGGKAVCTKCVVTIIKGKGNLSTQNADEMALREIHQIAKDGRVSCQTFINGDITVDTPYW